MPIKNIPPLLIRYVEKEILPLYDDFDAAHRQEHVRMVVRQSLELAQMINDGTITIDAVTYVSEPMVYVTAAYHDVGMTVNRKYHHLHSGEKVRQDRNLLQWFSPEQIEVIACAVEDHRASAKTTPRSIYGKIVSEADRYIVPEDVVLRTLQYGLENYPGLDQQGQWERTLEHLRDKYGYGGYLKLWFEAGTNYERLKSFQQMIAHDQAALREIFDKAYQQQMPSCPDQTSVYQSDAWRQMRSGEPYDATQPILIKELIRVRGLVARYNSMNPEDTEGLTRMLRQLLGGCGSNVSVVQPFRCDYGKNIFIGDNTYVNFNLTVLDEAKVTIGNNCFLGPNISIYTPCHPLNPKMRNTGQEWSLEVSIGDNCWLGGNVVVLPGVHIGNNVVIGAGSVVTKDVPDSQLWAGNPARFIKEVDTER